MDIKLTDIKESPHNARRSFDETKLKELAASIKEKGLLQAIIIRSVAGKYEIVCGARRFRAAKIAGLTEIKAELHNLNDKQALECQVIENLQREDIHPLEEAEGYEVLMKKHGYKDVKDIAAKVGKSATYIYGRLKLCELIPENRKFFYDGKFSPSVALLVARVPKDKQKEAGKDVATGEEYGDGQPLSYKEAKEYIEQNFMLELKEAPFDPKEVGLAKVGPCTACQKRTGNQVFLFPDISNKDTCTDPTCFENKKNAYAQRKLAEARAAGKKILSQDEAKKVLQYNSVCGNYVGLNDTCYQARNTGPYPTYRELVKKVKDADVICAVHPGNGKLVELITKPEVSRILKKLGVKDAGPVSTGEKIAEHKKEERVTTEKHKFYIDKISGNMDQRVKNVFIFSALQDRAQLDDVPFEDDIKEIYELGDEKVKSLIAKALKEMPDFSMYDDQDLDFICKQLGFSMAKDYMITKEYLEACTKDELVKLAKELGITIDAEKKGDLVAGILKAAPKGKVPKELVR